MRQIFTDKKNAALIKTAFNINILE